MGDRKHSDTSTVCDIHGTHGMVFYCEGHNGLICQFCKTVSHANCSLTNLHKLGADKAALADVKTTTMAQLKMLEDAADRKLKERKETDTMIRQTVRENHNVLKNLRVEVGNILDQYDASLDEYETQSSETLAAEIDKCTSFRRRVQEEIGLLERGYKHTEGMELVQTLFLAKQTSRQMENVLDTFGDGLNPISNFAETNREKVHGIVQQLSSLFRLEDSRPEQITDQSISGSSQNENKTFWKINSLGLSAEIDLKPINDTHTPAITGCEFLQDDQIILCDNENSKLKILGYGFKLKYELPLKHKPFDVARVDEKRTLISIPTMNHLQWVDTTPGLKLSDLLRVGNSCYGITFRDDKIYACVENIGTRYYYDKKVDYLTFSGTRIFSTTGKILTSIPHVGEGRPRYITVNRDGTKLFYSGKSDKDAFVTCTTKTGHGIYRYAGKMLSEPTTVLLDTEENLLVCDMYTKVLLAVNHDGVSCKCFLTEMDKLDTPMSMCCNEKENKLCIATTDSLRCTAQMKVFTFT